MLQDHLHQLNQAIRQACEMSNRLPNSVRLLPVSKTFGVELIQQAIDIGLTRFAENRAQELKEKATALEGHNLDWVLIGYLQINKAKIVARYATEIQSLDRWDLAVALDKHLQQENRSLDVLIQVKTSQEESKTGMESEQVPEFIARFKSLETLKLKGFMTVAEQSDNDAAVRSCFRRLAELAEQTRQVTGLDLPELSMGMSSDFRLAIAEGATQVRIGSLLFGERAYPVA